MTQAFLRIRGPLRYNASVMLGRVTGAGVGGRSVMGTVPIALLLLATTLSPGLASPEGAYKKSVAAFQPIDIVSGSQLQQARRAEPGKSLQVSGLIQGIFSVGEQRTILLQLVDNSTIEIECASSHQEIHPRARVRCLVKPKEPSPTAPLRLMDITWDKTPLELLQEAARAALKFPVTDREEIAQSAARIQRTQQAIPTRGGDQSTVIRRAIATLNPRFSARDVEVIGDSIIAYSARYNVDPTLVVAVIAAESRFNPNARSYKGAMGLGQLMPATAAAHNVDAWDPIENLHLAVRIIRKNLDRYNGDWNKALAAYNAGVGAVDRNRGVPPYRETRNYLWKIYEYWCWLNGIQAEARPR